MPKGVERKLERPLPGILSLLDIDFKSKGLSNMCQKWDNLCLQNIFVQKPCEYVDAFGEHIKEILDDVAKDWLNRSSNLHEGPVSDLSLEQDVITAVSKTSRMRIDDNSLRSIELDSFTFPMQDLNIDASRHVCVDKSQKYENSASISAEPTRFDSSDVTVEASKAVSEQSIPPKNLTVVAGNSVGFDADEFFVSHDETNFDIELMGENQNAEVEDWVDCSGGQEFTLVLDKLCKNTSYKRKLKHRSRSIQSSLKDSERLGIQNEVQISQDLDSNLGSSHNSYESDWELV